jgi:group II intron reverse transcriptase/maturase
LRKLSNTNKLQEFQRKLYEKAKACPKFRFYSLYDKTYRIDVLYEAYRRVKTNKGASGIDGQTFLDIEKNGLTEYLNELQRELKERRYKPQPVKRVYIPKANGKNRPLGIPTIRDRIVQMAFLIIIEPIYEADFKEASYGFRPNRSAHDAIREIYKYLNWGCVEVYDVDIEKYFDSVEHWKLLKLLSKRISDGQILKVIKQWLSSGYIEEGQHYQSKRGTPQGGVISPLLANVYLNPIDEAFEKKKLWDKSKGSIHIVRYADDIMVLAQRNLEKGINILEHYIERLGLQINQEKSQRIHLEEGKSIEFLGFEFQYVRSRKTQKRLILVRPSPKSQKRCREQIRKYVHHSIPLTIREQINNLNQFLRGWTGYFRIGNASMTFHNLRYFIERRVRRAYQRRKGKSGYGWNGISSERIYNELGLFNNYEVLGLALKY